MKEDGKLSIVHGPNWLSDRFQDVQPRSFQRLLGLRSDLLADRLLKNHNIKQLLSRDLCQELERRGGALPKMPVRDMRVLKKLVWLSPEEITSVARVLSLLLNRRTALTVTSGAAMAEIVDWVQNANALQLLRRETNLEFKTIDPATSFDIAQLDAYASALEPYLLGLLPERLFLQRCLRLPDADRPERVTLNNNEPMRSVLLSGLKLVMEIQENPRIQ